MIMGATGSTSAGKAGRHFQHKANITQEEGDKTKSIEFNVPGTPKGKARPRVVHPAAGRSMAYTAHGTVVYEAICRMEFYRAAGGSYDKPSSDLYFPGMVPLRVTVTVYYQIPASVSKKRRAEMLSGRLRPMKKPDADNVAKIILDALNGVAYHDDAQVVELLVEKRWAELNSARIRIEELPQ